MKPPTLAALLAISSTGIAPARQFEDQFGRTMEAELVAHWGAGNGFVKIDKAGKKLTVKIDAFSEKNQEEIVAWMNDNPGLLDPFVDPQLSGEGLVSGTKWLLISKARTLQIEFGGSGTTKINGALDKTTRWDVGADKHLVVISAYGAAQRFSKPVVSERIYQDPKSGALLVKLNRLPGALKPVDLINSSFVLTHHTSIHPFADYGETLAVVNFLEDGKAECDSNSLKWAIDKGGIGLRSERGQFAGFGAWARDVFVSRSGLVLWKVAVPRAK